ncbi:MAG TPA: cytochrome c-type biogenesis protein CcmH [Longimicrobiales bacterium]|nr:cytochrome c-type biogenesis protein CcmH [Longimicrobiales bacterium]
MSGRAVAAALLALLLMAGRAAAQEATPLAEPAGVAGQDAVADIARAVARDPGLEARATRLAAELRCPVCQGLSIQDSPSPLALQMKDLIRTQVGQGYTDAEVRGYFVSKYGEWVLLEPRASGFNLLVYLLPALALLAGAALVVVAVRRWTAPTEERAGP